MILFLLLQIAFSREVDFSWEAFDNAYAYQLQVASEIEFENILFKKVTKRTRLSAELPFGQMYYRVRAINQKKQPGVWSEPSLVLVKPYAPELAKPEDNASFVVFKKSLELVLSWKKQEEADDYTVLIKKKNGPKVLEETVSSNQLTWKIHEAGSYTWQVRSTFNGKHSSDFSEARNIKISNRNMGSPLLIAPEDNSVHPAYRKMKFTWEYFPPSVYSTIELKGPRNQRWRLKERDFFNLESLAPGKYQWRVGSSEAKKSALAQSEWRSFTVSEEMISKQDHFIGMRLSFSNTEVNTTSSRSGADSGSTSFDDNHTAYEWYGNWQLNKHHGLLLELERIQADIASEASLNAMNLMWTMRFGTNDFRQDFVIGVRQRSLVEFWRSSGTLNTNRFIARGLLVGMKMMGRLQSGLRLHLDLLYASPGTSLFNQGELGGDQAFFNLGLSKKIYQKIWAYYYASFERESFSIEDNNGGKTRWKSERLIPVQLGLEYRY